MRLGTNILQISARTPAATAMAAMTLDHLSGGRFILGLGASGPQVVEGWYGQPYPKPLARTREYIEVIRAILKRDEPVTHEGEFYPLPYPGGMNLGKPLKSTVHPLREDIPIFLGAEGPKNVALAAEIADGWLPMFFSPKTDDFYRAALAEGFARPGARRSLADFEVPAFLPVIVNDDVEAAADFVRPVHRAVHRRHGREVDELPRRRLRPARLPGRGREDPGALPRRAQGRGDRRGAHRAHRGHRADRPDREDQGRVAEVGADGDHHAARCRPTRACCRRSPTRSAER